MPLFYSNSLHWSYYKKCEALFKEFIFSCFHLFFLPKRNFFGKILCNLSRKWKIAWLKSSVSATKNKWKQEIKKILWKELHISCYNSNVMNYYIIVTWNYDWVHEKEVVASNIVTENSIGCLQIQVHSTGLSKHRSGQRSKIMMEDIRKYYNLAFSQK